MRFVCIRLVKKRWAISFKVDLIKLFINKTKSIFLVWFFKCRNTNLFTGSNDEGEAAGGAEVGSDGGGGESTEMEENGSSNYYTNPMYRVGHDLTPLHATSAHDVPQDYPQARPAHQRDSSPSNDGRHFRPQDDDKWDQDENSKYAQLSDYGNECCKFMKKKFFEIDFNN